MKPLFAILSFALAVLPAAALADAPPNPFTFYLHDTTGTLADTPLPPIYQFASTAVGSNSHIVLKAINSSAVTVFLAIVYVSSDTTSTNLNTNFTVTGLFDDLTMAPGASTFFTVNFSPLITGPITAYMHVAYQVRQGNCDFTSTTPATQCPGNNSLVNTLTGAATPPQLVLSYLAADGSSVRLQPGATTPVNFGNVSLSATSSISFSLANESTVAIATPSIDFPPPNVTSQPNPFTIDLTGVPSSIAPGTSAAFKITFAPGQDIVVNLFLYVGSETYDLQGSGIVPIPVADITSLQISYVDCTGVSILPQAAMAIPFGQISAGECAGNTANTLTFTLANPPTSFNPVTVPSLTVTGAGFALTGAPTMPVSISPGQPITFQIVFSPTVIGVSTGSLIIGTVGATDTREFSLSGLSVAPLVPSMSFQLSAQPLTSQQQPNLTVQLASASPLDIVGQLTMTFTPSVSNVSDDPAIFFLATSGRTLSVSLATGQLNATYNGQSNLAFQTGTTAGTITFTATFPDSTPYSQSFTIPPALVQITSATALLQNPNLLVTLSGYDNTYTAGPLVFTFYDVSGNVISPVQVNALANFQQLFFTNNTAGGTFSLQAAFPVTGDVTKVGSVAVTMNNSAGQASTNQTFH